MHAKTWFPSNEMHKSPNLTNGPLCIVNIENLMDLPTLLKYQQSRVSCQVRYHRLFLAVSKKLKPEKTQGFKKKKSSNFPENSRIDHL